MTPPVREAVASSYVLSSARLQTVSLWLLLAVSAIAVVEPSPYDVVFLITALIFLGTGLRVSAVLVPLILLILAFNVGGAFSLVPFLDKPASVAFIVISFYMGVTAVFFASLMLEDTKRRLDVIENGWIFAGVITAACGIAGYANIAGTAEIFTKYSRATGTFKDPNVFGPFVAVPAVLLIQRFLSGTVRSRLLSGGVFLILLGGVFLSFSRGAWGVLVVASALTGILLILNGGSPATRARVILMGAGGAVFVALGLLAILSIDSVRELFELRFALVQDYDGGPRGRFGKLTGGISLLLEQPNGVGPLRFGELFGEAPHNVFVNAFASYGWLGGLAYLALIAVTLRLGWATVWLRTPWQGTYIALWSVTFCQILQGLQIDTDHWRHLWLLIGLTWGIAAVSRRYAAGMARSHPGTQRRPEPPQEAYLAR